MFKKKQLLSPFWCMFFKFIDSHHQNTHMSCFDSITQQILMPLWRSKCLLCLVAIFILTSPSTLLQRSSSLMMSSDPCAQSSRFIRFSRVKFSSKFLSASSKHCWNGGAHSGDYFKIKTIFPGMGIPITKIRQSWDRLIFIVGFPILARYR